MTIAELSDVTFCFDDAETPVLSDVNLTLQAGELVLVAGRTGSGKSTLLGMFNGLVPHFTGGTLAGEIRILGDSIVSTPPRELAHIVGYVPQDPLSSFVGSTVEEELAYGMEQLGLEPQTMRRRVEETLDLLGIAHLRRRSMRTLSGGQQQRVAIGAVLTMHPKLLVLDEPTSALDPVAAEEVLATLARLVDDLELTVVLAEHRMERVVPFVDRIAIVDQGTVRIGEPSELLQDAPVAPPIVELGRLAAWDPLPLSVREARGRARKSPLDLTELKPELAKPGELALAARGISVMYGPKIAVNKVDLDLKRGEILTLMGRNGCGKSSLMWALQGSGKRHSGTVQVDGKDPAKLGADEARMLVGLVPQTAADLLYLESVAEECAAADQHAGASAGTTRSLLDRLAPGVDGAQHPRDLSEGQRLSLVLAIVLAAEPHVILLDEPTRGLDYSAKRGLATILKDLANRQHAVMLTTHDVEFVAHVADRVLVMADGEMVSEGQTRNVLAESPAFAPQISKILGSEWLTVEEVRAALPTSVSHG